MAKPKITTTQEKGFARLVVTPAPAGGVGLPQTYLSMSLAEAAAERLHREKGWIWKGRKNEH